MYLLNSHLFPSTSSFLTSGSFYRRVKMKEDKGREASDWISLHIPSGQRNAEARMYWLSCKCLKGAEIRCLTLHSRIESKILFNWINISCFLFLIFLSNFGWEKKKGSTILMHFILQRFRFERSICFSKNQISLILFININFFCRIFLKK